MWAYKKIWEENKTWLIIFQHTDIKICTFKWFVAFSVSIYITVEDGTILIVGVKCTISYTVSHYLHTLDAICMIVNVRCGNEAIVFYCYWVHPDLKKGLYAWSLLGWVYRFIENGSVYLKYVHFIIHKLYLTKKELGGKQHSRITLLAGVAKITSVGSPRSILGTLLEPMKGHQDSSRMPCLVVLVSEWKSPSSLWEKTKEQWRYF